jgi:AcrR family transcriptional regulator
VAGLRAAQKEMTRKLLLSTALELFGSKGYMATTIDDIAAEAGTTRVTFYAYFPSRSDLVRALIGELNEVLERTDSPGSTANTLVAAVRDGRREAIEAWLQTTAKQWDTIRPYMNAAVDAAMSDPELRGLVDRWLDEAISDIHTGLDQADRFPAGDRRLRGVLAMAQLDHVARSWSEGRPEIERDQMLEVLVESWCHLLAGCDAESSG